ncbi:MAG: hypothetical protein L3J47_00145 [Sulfurovum sp.]|nr:hypothetical protein [Sulfurovum sp.]
MPVNNTRKVSEFNALNTPAGVRAQLAQELYRASKYGPFRSAVLLDADLIEQMVMLDWVEGARYAKMANETLQEGLGLEPTTSGFEQLEALETLAKVLKLGQLRLGQLISNVVGGQSLFYLSDADMLKALQRELKRLRNAT